MKSFCSSLWPLPNEQLRNASPMLSVLMILYNSDSSQRVPFLQRKDKYVTPKFVCMFMCAVCALVYECACVWAYVYLSVNVHVCMVGGVRDQHQGSSLITLLPIFYIEAGSLSWEQSVPMQPVSLAHQLVLRSPYPLPPLCLLNSENRHWQHTHLAFTGAL